MHFQQRGKLQGQIELHGCHRSGRSTEVALALVEEGETWSEARTVTRGDEVEG
jgi:hypothetical protein